MKNFPYNTRQKPQNKKNERRKVSGFILYSLSHSLTLYSVSSFSLSFFLLHFNENEKNILILHTKDKHKQFIFCIFLHSLSSFLYSFYIS